MEFEYPRSSKVFISYSHDSPEHKEHVLQLSNRLCNEGIDCNIDQYETSPSNGWSRWMFNQIDESDFVLVVCTETYGKRFMGKDETGKGRGANWEGGIITQRLYDAELENTQFIPIIFSSNDSKHIPVILRGATYYNLEIRESYNELYARLTYQRLISKPKIGELRYLMPRNFPLSTSIPDTEFKLTSNNPKPIIGEVRGVYLNAPEEIQNSTQSCEILCKNCGNWFRSKIAQCGDSETFINCVIYSNKEFCPHCKIKIRYHKKDMRFVERDKNGKIINEVRG